MMVHDRTKGKPTFSQPTKKGIEIAVDGISGQCETGAAESVDNSIGRTLIKASLYEAAMEGRLHPVDAALVGVETGQYVCVRCGMRNWTLDAADRCCAPGSDVWVPKSGRQRCVVADAVAVVEDAQALSNALVGWCLVRDINTRRHLSRKTGLTCAVLQRLHYCRTRWVVEKNWDILNEMFDGQVPGCKPWPMIGEDNG